RAAADTAHTKIDMKHKTNRLRNIIIKSSSIHHACYQVTLNAFFIIARTPPASTLFPYTTLFRSTGRLNVDGMNIISNDGSNKLNRSRKARVSYKVQRTINASLNAATSTRAVSSNPNFVTRQKIEIIFG